MFPKKSNIKEALGLSCQTKVPEQESLETRGFQKIMRKHCKEIFI